MPTSHEIVSETVVLERRFVRKGEVAKKIDLFTDFFARSGAAFSGEDQAERIIEGMSYGYVESEAKHSWSMIIGDQAVTLSFSEQDLSEGKSGLRVKVYERIRNESGDVYFDGSGFMYVDLEINQVEFGYNGAKLARFGNNQTGVDIIAGHKHPIVETQNQQV